MGTRKSAVDLTDAEVDALLQAILTLKATPAPGNASIRLYDQFVALHRAVMAVVTPVQERVNFGHGEIGFLPWHRQYLRAFETALQAAVPGVNLPYWDWADEVGTVNRLFTPEFLSSLRWGSARPVLDGTLRHTVPSADRPAWWPAGVSGFRLDGLLEEGMGGALSRGSTERSWPPSSGRLQGLIESNVSITGRHPLWFFWQVLEQGDRELPQTHNAGHRFVGGHMGGFFSPNDPIFWLHHANVDRIWDAWQRHRIDQGLSADAQATWPDPDETSPFNGRLAPEGHKLGDAMWPWLGGAPGYESVSVSRAVRNRLPVPIQRVEVGDVLDSAALGIAYAPPGSP